MLINYEDYEDGESTIGIVESECMWHVCYWAIDAFSYIIFGHEKLNYKWINKKLFIKRIF